jgi:hypothetical protein
MTMIANMNIGKHMQAAITRWLLAFSLCLSSTVWANADETEQSTLAVPAQGPRTFNLNEWHVPDTYGSIKEVYKGSSSKTVVYIQDAHCNFEAQQNNANILQDLVRNYGVHLVAVEGSTGIIDTTPFAQFPDKDIKTEVATYFMKKGRITGPEYLSITSDLSFRIFGIEDEKMYKINYDAFIKSLDLKTTAQAVISEFDKYASILKANLFTPELKEIDKVLADYKSNDMSFSGYADFLAASAASHSTDLAKYPNFVLQRKAKALEEETDFKAVDQERSSLIGRLEKAANKKQISDLVVKSLSFRMGKIGADEFYFFLRDLAAKSRIGISRYKNLSTYIDHLEVYSKIDTSALFIECDRLAEDIHQQLFKNPEQRQLASIIKELGFLTDLFELKLSSDDLLYYRSHKGDLNSSRFVSFFNQFTGQFGIPHLDRERFSTIDRDTAVIEDFYDAAKKRDTILVHNAVKKMESDAEELAVLVTGGFHTEGITDELKRLGYSYVVVTPRITDLAADNYYIDVMTNKKTPFEELLGVND